MEVLGVSYRILIADDESDIVFMLSSFFESKGFCVLPATNGAEALKQVEKPVSYTHLCIHPCKQSFRAVVLSCPHYLSRRSKKCGN